MGTVLVYTLIVAGITGIFSVALDLTLAEDKKAITVGFLSAVLAGILEILFILIFRPPFTHALSSGYFWSGIIVFLSTGIIQGFCYYIGFEDWDWNPIVGNIVIFGVALILSAIVAISMPAGSLPAWENANYDKLAALLNVRDATVQELEESATDDDLLKIHPAYAQLEAQGHIPQDLGSYAEINTAYEQTVNNQQVYITDLKVSNWRAFNEAGGALPGYLIRPAKDINAQTSFVAGHTLRYVPSARLLQDLDVHVYLKYVINCNCFVEHLDVLELDDEGQPWYTATSWKYTIGMKGAEPFEVIVINPTTGEITQYPIDDVPTWIDRVYSMNMMRQRVAWWATYVDWDAQMFFASTLGKMQIDGAEDVYGPNGKLYYMFTVTSVGSDQTLRYEIRVDPRTGEAVKFEASGKTLQAVDDIIDQRTYDYFNPDVGAEPVECERQRLLGVQTWYCILETRSTGEDKGAIVGYAFLQEQYTSKPGKVVAAREFNDAWSMFRKQVATGGGDDAEIQGEESITIAVEGTILLKGDGPTEDGNILFAVATEEQPQGIWFQVPADHPVITVTREGHQVQVIAYDLRIDHVNDAVELVNLDIPPMTVTP